MSERVFCSNCNFWECWCFSITDKCTAEGNRRYKPNYSHNWWFPIRHPRAINKFGDCRWYEEKECLNTK